MGRARRNLKGKKSKKIPANAEAQGDRDAECGLDKTVRK
jgi:hypothetical protein